MGKLTPENAGAFQIEPPHRLNFVMNPDSDALFDYVDADEPVVTSLPDDIPPDMPEFVTGKIDDPSDIIEALKKVVKAFNMAGRNAGRDKHLKTPGNRYSTHYAAQPGNSPDSMAKWMDGKELGLMVGVGLAKYNKPEDKKTRAEKEIEAEGIRVLDVLNGTAMRIAEGEPPAEVEASRSRLAGWLLHELRPGAEYKVDAGFKKVDADYRNRLHERPDVGMAFLSRLRIRSR